MESLEFHRKSLGTAFPVTLSIITLYLKGFIKKMCEPFLLKKMIQNEHTKEINFKNIKKQHLQLNSPGLTVPRWSLVGTASGKVFISQAELLLVDGFGRGWLNFQARARPAQGFLILCGSDRNRFPPPSFPAKNGSLRKHWMFYAHSFDSSIYALARVLWGWVCVRVCACMFSVLLAPREQ